MRIYRYVCERSSDAKQCLTTISGTVEAATIGDARRFVLQMLCIPGQWEVRVTCRNRKAKRRVFDVSETAGGFDRRLVEYE